MATKVVKTIEELKEAEFLKVPAQIEDAYHYRITPGDYKVSSVVPYSHATGVYVIRMVDLAQSVGAGIQRYITEKTLEHLPVAYGPRTIAAMKKKHTEIQERYPMYGVGNTRVHSLGSDPEIFITTDKGEIIPAWSVLPNSKKPLPTRGYMMSAYHDGFQAEWQVYPQTCIAYMGDGMQAGLREILNHVRKTHPTAKLDASPVMVVPGNIMEKTPDEHNQFGCLPSMNIYGHHGEVIENPKEFPFRFAGFHLHVAQNAGAKTPEWVDGIVKECDRWAGVISVAALAGLDNAERRKHYGLAGEYRLPNHGLEYRTLSSAYLWHPAAFMLGTETFRIAVHAYNFGFKDLYQASQDEVIACINNLDVDLAKRIIRRNRQVIAGCLEHCYENFRGQSKRVNFLMDELLLGPGFAGHIELDVEKNWHLTDLKWVGHSETPDCMLHKFVTARAEGYDPNKYNASYEGDEYEEEVEEDYYEEEE